MSHNLAVDCSVLIINARFWLESKMGSLLFFGSDAAKGPSRPDIPRRHPEAPVRLGRADEDDAFVVAGENLSKCR